MKSRMFRTVTAVLILLSLLTAPAAYAAGDIVYSNTRLLADNLEYINTITYSSAEGRRESFAVRMTGPGDAYPIVMRGETVFGALTISRMVRHAESLGKNVLAVVNTDFFSMQTGVPLGIVIEDGVYISSPSERNAICFGYDGSVFFVEEPTVQITLYNNGGGNGAYNEGESVDLLNFNKFRVDTGGMVLLTEDFSTVSTRTSSPGWFVRFRILEGRPSVSGTMTLEVTEMLESDGAIPIGEGNMILTAAHHGGFIAEYEKFAVGDIITMTTTPSDERLSYASQATGGGDILIYDGVKTSSAEWDSALLARAPRTAFGVRADGSVISYIVDGRDNTHSVGMTLSELTDELLRQGVVYAVNFDGGGSTALSIRLPGDNSAAVVSRPSGGSERGCATYLLFVTDAVSDGAARNLSIRNDGVIVLAGSSVDLNFVAADRGYRPVSVPGDIRAEPSAVGSSISGTRYTAGPVAGTDTIILQSSSAGAFGTGNIVVITRPTSITAARKGTASPLTSIRLNPGETLEIDIAATYYRREVTAQAHSFSYAISGNIGQMIQPGVFKAGNVMQQTGAITISAEGTDTVIRVEIGGFTDMQGHWARQYAEFILSAGITMGITPTEYGPDYLMKRGDYILMLHRAVGTPEPSGIGGFDDVPSGAHYAKALAWAKESGVAEAQSGNSFGPEESLTRQDAFTYTYRVLDVFNKRYDDGTAEDLARFPDAESLEDYALIPTATLIGLGIVEGSDGLLAPNDTMTRAQMAKVVTMVLELE